MVWVYGIVGSTLLIVGLAYLAATILRTISSDEPQTYDDLVRQRVAERIRRDGLHAGHIVASTRMDGSVKAVIFHNDGTTETEIWSYMQIVTGWE